MDAVILAIGRPEFEDGLRTGVLWEDSRYPFGIKLLCKSNMVRSMKLDFSLQPSPTIYD